MSRRVEGPPHPVAVAAEGAKGAWQAAGWWFDASVVTTGWQRWGAAPPVGVAVVDLADESRWHGAAARVAALGAVVAGVLARHHLHG